MSNKMIEVKFKTPNGDETTRRGFGPKSVSSKKIASSIISSAPKNWVFIDYKLLKEW